MKLPCLLTLLAAALSAPVLADTTLNYAANGKPSHSVSIAGGQVAMRADAQSDVVFDSKARTLTVFNRADKTYTRMDEARMQQMAAVAGQAMKNMEGLLANLPEEQRAQIRGMMPGGGASLPKIEVRDTGRKAQVGGRDCQLYETRMNGQLDSELCVVPRTALQIEARDLATLQSLFRFTEQIATQMGMAETLGNEWQLLGDRVPLRIVETEGERRIVHELKSVSKDKVPSSRFAIPAGYTEQAITLPNVGG